MVSKGDVYMKRYRCMKIKEIIQSQVIETQEDLTLALQKEGIVVTQATVSRDIKELGLIKVPYANKKSRYALSSETRGTMSKNHTVILFQEAVIKIDTSMNLVVIHTVPGSAQAVAASIDQSKHPEIIGTLAGDDTILIILKTAKDVKLFKGRIKALLES